MRAQKSMTQPRLARSEESFWGYMAGEASRVSCFLENEKAVRALRTQKQKHHHVPLKHVPLPLRLSCGQLWRNIKARAYLDIGGFCIA